MGRLWRGTVPAWMTTVTTVEESQLYSVIKTVTAGSPVRCMGPLTRFVQEPVRVSSRLQPSQCLISRLREESFFQSRPACPVPPSPALYWRYSFLFRTPRTFGLSLTRGQTLYINPLSASFIHLELLIVLKPFSGVRSLVSCIINVFLRTW